MTHSTSVSIIVLGHFANFKLAGDRAVRDALYLLRRESSLSPVSNGTTVSQIRATGRSRRRRRGIRARHASRSTRIGVMSDADLEAELAARRASRARERERYARAMRSEKLSVLEGELIRLRSEISRLGRPTGTGVGSGTPPTARWEALPHNRTRAMGSPSARSSVPYPNVPPVPLNGPPGTTPPPPPPGVTWEDEEPVDPERQKREKEERVRRREAKRKEREAAKKPMTLADIIRGAGPDPMKRLKPSGSTQLEDVFEIEEMKTENFSDIKGALKKVEGVPESSEEKSEDNLAKGSSVEEEKNKQVEQTEDEGKKSNEKSDEKELTSMSDMDNGKDEKRDGDRLDGNEGSKTRLSDISTHKKGGNIEKSGSTSAHIEQNMTKTENMQQATSTAQTAVAKQSSTMKRHVPAVPGSTQKNSPVEGPQPGANTGISSRGEGKGSEKSAEKRTTKNAFLPSEALSAVASLTSKLHSSQKTAEEPVKVEGKHQERSNEPNASTSIGLSGSRKRLSLVEKRDMRRVAARESGETAGKGNANGVDITMNSIAK